MMVLFAVVCAPVNAQVASFDIPDTVCVNTPLKIQNTSTGGSTYFWNFCSGSLFSTPVVSNLGNINGNLNVPTFLSTAKDGNNYYAFVTNNVGQLVRYNFGSSFLNTPTSDNFGSLGGAIPIHTEGVQVIQDINGWHVIVVGGTLEVQPNIVKVDFGSSLANTPTATNWGNMGNMDHPIDLYITQEGNNWYGFTVNFLNNTVTRFDFGNSVGNMPTAVNLGNLGDLDHPTGIFAIQDNGNWYAFITNESTSTVTRLDFGNSIANTPTGVNLGSGGGIINRPRDISIIRDCGKIFGLVVSAGASDLTRIDFASDITSNFTATALNVGGNFSFPHCISPVFREGNDLYAFIANAYNNTLSRLVFSSCNNSSIASSLLKDPPDVTYSAPGVYTINLLMNESLPTQTTYCKNIVVVDLPVVDLGADLTICDGGTAALDAGSSFSSYLWNTGATSQQISATASGTYQVEVSNGGCTVTDDVIINISQVMNMTAMVTDITCLNPLGRIEITATGGTSPYTYYIGNTNNGSNNVFDGLSMGLYTIQVVDNAGCRLSRIAEVKKDPTKDLDATAVTTSPSCYGDANGVINVQVGAGTGPFEYALQGGAYQPSPDFTNLSAGNYVVLVRNASCYVEVPIALTGPDELRLAYNKTDEHCSESNGEVNAVVIGGTPPYSYYWDNTAGGADITGLQAGAYQLLVTDQQNCSQQATVILDNLTLPPVYITNNDTTINIGQSVKLHAINAVDYAWTPVTGLSCTDCADPVATPRETTTYTVTTVTGMNCTKTDVVTVNVTFNNSLYIPTAFTPNGDGVNDQFVVKARGVAIYNIRIFNRWGQQVFFSDNVSAHWDGKFNSLMQPAGSYVYIVTYSYFGQEDKELMQKGAFTLIR
jgi:gliding motility-associated-like protein